MSDLAQGTATPIGLIGGIGLTEVHVYAQRPAPDGSFSGCPHVHAVTDEAYFVLQGRGSVEFHDRKSGYRKVALEPGQYMHFPPLMMHRLISEGDLVVLGMMGNAGLAEHGDARIYFGSDVDADADRFSQLQSLPKMRGLEGALKRRDESVAAYQHLMKLWSDDRPRYFAELNRFVAVHCAAMAALKFEFITQVETGPRAWGAATRQRIMQLPNIPDVPGDVQMNARGTNAALGMCGVLRPVFSLKPVDSVL